MTRFLRKFRYGEKGFTLIELLVVVAILGVLAAVAVPNVGKFLGQGQEEAKLAEQHNVQTAVMAAMADSGAAEVQNPGSFGNTAHADNSTRTDLLVYTDNGTSTEYWVGDYIMGQEPKVQGDYTVATDGTVLQVWYPGD